MITKFASDGSLLILDAAKAITGALLDAARDINRTVIRYDVPKLAWWQKAVLKIRRWQWQDVILTVGEIVFLTSLLPSVLSDQKPAAATSFATAVMLFLFLAVHVSKGWWGAFTLTLVTASLWLTMGIQVAF